MNTKSNTLPDPETVLKEMFDTGQLNAGIIKDGLCATPQAQDEFDQQQTAKPPITE